MRENPPNPHPPGQPHLRRLLQRGVGVPISGPDFFAGLDSRFLLRDGMYFQANQVAAKLPEKIIQEDEKLLMYYDVATMRLGEE